MVVIFILYLQHEYSPCQESELMTEMFLDYYLKGLDSKNMSSVFQVIVDLTQERDYLSGQQPQEGCRNLLMSRLEHGHTSGNLGLNNGGSAVNVQGLNKEEKQHLSVELADTKAKLRRYRQEL